MPMEKREWRHPTGAHAWMEEVPGVLGGKEIKQANLHVRVPEEHRRQGIAKELLLEAVRDLEAHNLTAEPQDRYHNAFVNLAAPQPEGARQTFESAGFKVTDDGAGGLLLRRWLANYE